MTSAVLSALALAWAVAAGLQSVLWLVQQRTRNAAIVDVGWAASFSLFVLVFALRSPLPSHPWLPAASVVVLWSLRLSGYLISRGAITGEEEGRYVDLRSRWGSAASAKFFLFFQAQALLAAVLSSAFVVPFFALPARPALLYVGDALSLLGVIGESTADFQLARFRRSHRGQVCDVGLWSWSRHPNYFFEWCVWVGHAVVGFAFGWWGLIAVVPQAIILASIWGVTGIPPTESQALRSKGDKYRAYQARVSKFVPWPPKRA